MTGGKRSQRSWRSWRGSCARSSGLVREKQGIEENRGAGERGNERAESSRLGVGRGVSPVPKSEGPGAPASVVFAGAKAQIGLGRLSAVGAEAPTYQPCPDIRIDGGSCYPRSQARDLGHPFSWRVEGAKSNRSSLDSARDGTIEVGGVFSLSTLRQVSKKQILRLPPLRTGRSG